MSSTFQNKMYNFEVTPPSKTWEKIAAALDEPELADGFSSKLYHLEATPPLAAWEKIKLSLNADQETVVPVKRKLSPLFRYAAAAVLIGLFIFGGIKLLNNGPGKKEVAKEEKATPFKDSLIPSSDESIPPVNNSTVESDEARDNAALEASKHIVAKIDLPSVNKLNLIKGDYLSTPADYIDNISNPDDNYLGLHYSETLQPAFAHIETATKIADRYITLMTPDGNIIRMSKKWGDLVCCVSGAEQDANCKDQLQKWREKIACSPLVPSSGNFMDIFSLISSLQNNKD